MKKLLSFKYILLLVTLIIISLFMVFYVYINYTFEIVKN